MLFAGIPAVIYLTMNPSMRQDIERMFKIKRTTTSVGPDTVRLDATVVNSRDALPNA